MSWLKSTNATVSDVLCAGPEAMKGKRLNDMTSLHNECTSTGEAGQKPLELRLRAAAVVSPPPPPPFNI